MALWELTMCLELDRALCHMRTVINSPNTQRAQCKANTDTEKPTGDNVLGKKHTPNKEHE